jgi:D-amino peptidase
LNPNLEGEDAIMKLLIAADMEGITGVTNWNHVDPAHPEYQRFRRLMTADVNAAVRGAADAGVEDIVVADGHSNAENILIEDLDPRARLNSGSPSPFAMIQGIDQAVDAVFLIGYHARMGTANAILDHTWSSARVQNVWLNGTSVGEIGLNASVCGHFGAAVLLLSGDQSAAKEAVEWIPGIETVIVKRASGRSAAELLPPSKTQALIRESAQRALETFMRGQGPAPLQTQSPVTVGVEFLNSELADRAALLPGSERCDGRKIQFVSPDMAAAYLAFRASVALANRA